MSDERIKKTFERLGEQLVLRDDLRAAIGAFLANFAVFESLHLSAVLKAVSTDPIVIEHLAELMPVEQRMRLLRHLCRSHQVPEALMVDVRYVLNTADDLRQHRNEIAHGAAVLARAGATMSEAESSPPVAGVRKALSKRPKPTEGLDVRTFTPKSLHTAPTIRAWAVDAEALQNSTAQLAQKLGAWKRAEPWEEVVVSKPGPISPAMFGAADEEPSAG